MTGLPDRPEPGALLARLQKEEPHHGKLHIFLGMCPGVGKTYAMLQTARKRMEEGTEVLAGLVETHGRPETAVLLEGIPSLPRRKLSHHGTVLEEFDLDAALASPPSLILVDELAHTNAPGARHAKRYQDVLELLAAGIDVYSTLNVQHIESQVDIVRQITGIVVRETIPDSILDSAHEIQLIDLSVGKLLERLAEGKVCIGPRAEEAARAFFRERNLTALRELALRLTAERVDRDLDDIRRFNRVGSPWKTNPRLMVEVGPDPLSESLIRWTRRCAARLNCPWLAVRVEAPGELSPPRQELLSRSSGLARRLGGEVVSVMAENTAQGLLQLARERNVTQLIMGKPEPGWRGYRDRCQLDRIIRESGDIDISLVRPLPGAGSRKKRGPEVLLPPGSLMAEWGEALVVVTTVASLGWSLVPLTGPTFAALLFLLAMTVAGLRLQPGTALFMACLSTFCWAFFFLPPQFTLSIRKAEDWPLLGIFFLATSFTGGLISRLRQREKAERQRLRQTEALLQVTQCATLTAGKSEGLAQALRTITGLVHGPTALVVPRFNRTLPSSVHPASTFLPTAEEWGVVAWSFDNRQSAGRFTDTLPHASATWFPLQTATSIVGVLGVKLPPQARLDFALREMLETFARQLALVLEEPNLLQAVVPPHKDGAAG